MVVDRDIAKTGSNGDGSIDTIDSAQQAQTTLLQQLIPATSLLPQFMAATTQSGTSAYSLVEHGRVSWSRSHLLTWALVRNSAMSALHEGQGLTTFLTRSERTDSLRARVSDTPANFLSRQGLQKLWPDQEERRATCVCVSGPF